MKRLNLRPAFLLAVFFTVFVYNGRAQDLDAARLLTRSEQYDKAEEMLNKLIQQEPANSRNYFYLGENHLAEFFADTISNSLTVSANSAKEAYQKGVDANPNDPLNYIGLAKVAFYLGDEATANEMRTKARSFLLPYKNLRRISPPAPEYAYTLAKIAESYIKDETVDTSAALPLIREALKIDNMNRDVYLVAGDIWILVPDGSKAIAMYNQAEFADPKSPTALMKIGNIYVRGRAWTPAINNFEQAIEIDPDFAPAYRELGQVYLRANRFEQSKEYFKKYLDLTAGNIPAKIRYVNALFYARDYDGVISNVEDIFKVDQSRTYMNRIAGYSCFEKDPPDYDKALQYMETLFKTVATERILWKDYYYMARILLRKNQDYPKMVDELNASRQQLEREKARNSTASSSAEKAKIKASMDALAKKITDLQASVSAADKEIDRAFGEYAKVLELRPGDKVLLNEMATNYYTYKRYEGAARTWSKLLGPEPTRDNIDELMRIGRTYYTGEKYKSADSVFTAITNRFTDYIPAYLWIANTYTRMDPETTMGLAKPKFEKLLEVAKSDSIANSAAMMDALKYLSYYYMMKDNFSKSKDYYTRMINLDPKNNDYKIAGYSGIGLIELRSTTTEKTNEGRLPYLARASDAYNKILAIDPSNAAAKSQLSIVRDYEAQIRKGINPNEIKGVIKNGSGQPIPYASVRVKDTAAESLTKTSGEYKFEIPEGSEALIVTAKGYRTVEIPITKSRVYNVTLEQ